MLTYTQRFNQQSQVQTLPHMQGILLAAPLSSAQSQGPFFRGQVRNPLLFRDLLLCLAEIVNARFYRPDLWRYLDPVLTCESEQVRMECFSSCASLYGRVDLHSGFFDGYALLQRGSTNVNFQPAFVQGLSRLRPGQATVLEVGADAIELQLPSGSLREEKVKLPPRWIQGFLQSQALFRSASLWHELSGLAARQFLLGLKAADSGTRYLRLRGGQLENCPVKPAQGESLAVAGLHRLSLARKLLPHLQKLSIYHSPSGTSIWVFYFPEAQLSLGLSRSIKHGFSGEGEALRSLSQTSDPAYLDFMRHLLTGLESFQIQDLADFAECSTEKAQALADQLAMAGVLGYDNHSGRHFYRVLPFTQTAHQRVNHAHRLLQQQEVTLETVQASEAGFRAEGWVQGSAHYAVSLTVQAGLLTEATCTCPWIQRHGLKRGPCKHILALRFAAESHLPQS